MVSRTLKSEIEAAVCDFWDSEQLEQRVMSGLSGLSGLNCDEQHEAEEYLRAYILAASRGLIGDVARELFPSRGRIVPAG